MFERRKRNLNSLAVLESFSQRNKDSKRFHLNDEVHFPTVYITGERKPWETMAPTHPVTVLKAETE